VADAGIHTAAWKEANDRHRPAADGLLSKHRLGRSSYYVNVALTSILVRTEAPDRGA
jgi:hypothetical protein